LQRLGDGYRRALTVSESREVPRAA
jgi:hypothetical protein